MHRSASRLVLSAAAATSLLLGLAACGSDSDPGAGAPAAAVAKGTVVVGAVSNGAARQTVLKVPEVASIRAELPASVRKSGKLVVGLGFLPAGSPPIGYIGTDQKTLTGSEPDLGRLVAAVLGLQPQLTNATWDNLFIGIDSGRTDVGFSNITDTEQRKEKYDFSSYRQDNLGFEVRKDDPWTFTGDYHALAGKTVAVGSGTNQEKILLAWQKQLEAQGKKLTVTYYQEANSTYLALNSHHIDAYFAPNPSVAYHVAKTAGSPQATRSAGTYSGAGASLQGLICATTKKGDGLVEPLNDAINYLIKNGQYAKWLAAWNLSNEAVPSARINPPGLPLSNS
ncbi:amino acid ABC transporter substrate-binding protein, PAAT family [Actinacidiphila yanglinensis]|uniref:Amino acid ABC transporter substrate-binding protein, PAAT family n=1 Tax=Actinacidiphila yanglinensis TaxID=310779 RepID=A0A1H6E8R6_9ACTN|nr:ABC transporter substrate-binding protein [Actinacidiphila yanglinensis]SEG93326.1 amino acid ABC transporter substrate-binding protein, PAAT family [Actinacidiphila yanglinensis]